MRRRTPTKSLAVLALVIGLVAPAAAFAGGRSSQAPTPARPATTRAASTMGGDAVEVVTTAKGVRRVEIYTPAPGVEPEALAARLRSRGLPAKVANENSSAVAASSGLGGAANRVGQPCWAWVTARTITRKICYVRWKRSGFAQPQIRLADRSRGWPVRAAAKDWDRSTAFNLHWARSCAGRSKGVHCVTVHSGRYGLTGWSGITRMDWYQSRVNHRWYWRGSMPRMVRLNDSYNPIYPAGGHRQIACHELGHALGLHHTVGGGASCLNVEAWVSRSHVFKHPSMDDLILLKRISISGS